MEPFWSLGQSIVYHWNNYQKHLCDVALKNIFSQIFLQTIIKGSVAEFIFNEIPCFQHIFQNTFRQMRLKNENYIHLILDIQTTLTLQRPHCKSFWWNYTKSENCKLHLGNREQKWLFLVVSPSTCTLTFILRTHFFECPIGRANKIACPKT